MAVLNHKLQKAVLVLLLFGLLQPAFACIEFNESYPGDSSTDAAASDFDEFDYLVSNYEQGMVIDSATVCQKDFDGTTFIIGLSLNLINRSTGETSTGSYHGLSQADYPGDSTVSCQTQQTTGTVYEVIVGINVYTSAFLMRVNAIKFGQKPVGSIEFGDLNVSLAQQSWNFDLSYGGFIGIYGNYTEMLNSVGPYYNPGSCDCSETILKTSSSISDMAASVTTGTVSVQTILPFLHSYEEQGRGSCGTQSYSVLQIDGASCASFLGVSGDQLLLASTDSGQIGQYEIRLTVTMDDYPTIQITQDFTVYIVELGPGPSYVSSRDLKVLEGPYSESNTCFTSPDFGFTFLRDVSATGLPSYASLDTLNIEVTADPLSDDDAGDTFSVNFTCELSEFVDTMGIVEMPVAFTVTENVNICADSSDLTDSTCCLDPFDLTDTTCCPDSTNTADTNCCPDPSNTADPNCPICPDSTNLADTTCCLDPFDLTDATCCPDPFNTADSNCCPDANDTSDPNCCPDPTNSADPNCPVICADHFDLADTTCCLDRFVLTDLTCCPDSTNTADTNCCPDPSNTGDPNCPAAVCPDPYDLTNSDCCPDASDTSDPTCCPDPTNSADSNCPVICVDLFDLTDTTCCLNRFVLTDPTCCPDSTNTADTNCCPNPNNSADPNCPVICPDPLDLTDPTCLEIEDPGDEEEPDCPDSTNPLCDDYEEVVDDEDDNDEVFEQVEIHEYYIPSGGGPTLNDYFAFPGTLTDRFVLKGLDAGFEWTYSVYNDNPVDELFVEFWGDREIHYKVDVACNKVSFFVDCVLSDDNSLIQFNSTGVKDESLFGTTFPIYVRMENEIEQVSEYLIEIVLEANKTTSPDEEEDQKVEIEEIETIEEIVVDYAIVDIKGLMKLQFKEYITSNGTVAQNTAGQGRLLQSATTEIDTSDEDVLVIDLTIDESINGLDENVTQLEYKVTEFDDKMVQIQMSFDCPECISSFESDVMTVTGRSGDKVLFTYEVTLPPQVNKDDKLVEIIEYAASFTVFAMGGTVVLAILLDLVLFQRFKYQALFQAIEIWQQVCYVQLLGVPLPGYVLLYTPELMPAINFDIFHFLEKYWRELTLFDLVHNEEVLGINLVTFGFDSVHFFQNARSSVALTGGTIILLFLVSTFGCCSKRAWKYMVASFIVFLKTIVYLVLILSATIQLRYNGDDGLQTALALLSQCFLALSLPVYFTYNSCREKRFPSRPNLTLALRALTVFAVAYGTDYPGYQFLFLMAIHVLFVVFNMARFNKYSTARSLGLSWSYGALPTLIFSLRFDQSGLFPVGLSALTITHVTIWHVFISDLVYQCRISSAKRRYAAQRKAITQKKRKQLLAQKRRNELHDIAAAENNLPSGSGLASGQQTPQHSQDLSKVEMHGFGATETELPQQESQLLEGKGRLVLPLVMLGGKNKNKVVPIMEVPSSDSERSLSMKQTVPVTLVNSVRSSDPDSFGFIPRENAPVRTTSMNGEALATGAGLMMITTEGDEDDGKATSGGLGLKKRLNSCGDFGADGGDHSGHDENNGLAQSLNFSNGAGKLSKIDFLHGSEHQQADVDIVSFNELEEAKGERRSDFNEDLLHSSGSDQVRAQKAKQIEEIPSGEFILKTPKQKDNLMLSKEVEISIDIDWPAQKIQSEYEKQQTQKNQLLFGPNWQFQGQQLDLNQAKKEVYKWKKDEERQRSMVMAQEPSIVVSQVADDTREKKQSPILTKSWVADLLHEKNRSSLQASNGFEKDSMVQEILKDYQSAPLDESVLNQRDPLMGSIGDGGPHHQRVNTASMEQFMTGSPRSSPKRNSLIRNKQVDVLVPARELQLFSRSKKKRDVVKK